ncbi:nuclear matrix associated phosphoprotein [Marssonina coronariae]|uniref:Nuclear matrix associated phosphoprotein n=1 Tax=Diplocarpon coronariae TaxID=2795749 RepID=A0A218ZI13_9HELO|nr:nuclear matrix associated phosphoprotein [Marssonina coronariae]
MIDLARPGCCQVSSSAWVLSGSENIDLASGLTSALPIHTSNWVYQVATHVQDFHADVRKRSATWSSHPSTKTQNLPSGLAPASTRSLTSAAPLHPLTKNLFPQLEYHLPAPAS